MFLTTIYVVSYHKIDKRKDETTKPPFTTLYKTSKLIADSGKLAIAPLATNDRDLQDEPGRLQPPPD